MSFLPLSVCTKGIMFSFLFRAGMSCRDKTDSKLRRKVMPAKETKIYSFENIAILFPFSFTGMMKSRAKVCVPLSKCLLNFFMIFHNFIKTLTNVFSAIYEYIFAHFLSSFFSCTILNQLCIETSTLYC